MDRARLWKVQHTHTQMVENLIHTTEAQQNEHHHCLRGRKESPLPFSESNHRHFQVPQHSICLSGSSTFELEICSTLGRKDFLNSMYLEDWFCRVLDLVASGQTQRETQQAGMLPPWGTGEHACKSFCAQYLGFCLNGQNTDEEFKFCLNVHLWERRDGQTLKSTLTDVRFDPRQTLCYPYSCAMDGILISCIAHHSVLDVPLSVQSFMIIVETRYIYQQ